MAEKEEKIEVEGEVLEAFQSGVFKVALDNGHETLAYTAGKMRRYRIRIAPGDRIKLELSPYDLGRGRSGVHDPDVRGTPQTAARRDSRLARSRAMATRDDARRRLRPVRRSLSHAASL